MITIILKLIKDPLVMFGFFAQFIFFLRFVVQWYVSERKKESIIPISFWYLSIVGTVMILIYSYVRRDAVFIVASLLNSLIYIRNIYLIKQKQI